MFRYLKKYIVRIIAVFLIVSDTVEWFIHARRTKRVIKGIEVDCGTEPLVASLRNTTSQKHLCGATVLSQEFAITAAHCVHSLPEDYFLQLNNYCIQDEAIPRASVMEIITHDLYDRNTRAHDIALLRIIFLDDIICLNESMLPSSSFGVSGECTIYGYGIKDINTSEATDMLNAGKLEIVSLDQCTSKLGIYVAPKYDSGMMCAVGDDGVDACQGDSGSPLICAGLIEGLCSYGMSCGVNGIPGVYTSVGAHLQWIHDIIDN